MKLASGGRYRTQDIEWQARLQGVELASFRTRALAFLIDGLVILIVLLVPSLWTALDARTPNRPLTVSFEFGSLATVVFAVAYFGLSTFLGRGATLGKRLRRIRVVSLVQCHMSLWRSVERALGYSVSFLEGGFGFLQYFRHPNRQTVHDRIAATIVVVDRRARARTATQPFVAPHVHRFGCRTRLSSDV